MAKDGNLQTPAGRGLQPAAACGDARQCIAAACRQVHAGKLAARQLGVWVAGRGVTEADFRLLWQLFAAAETALASAARAGRGGAADAPLEPAILDQATIAERLAASPAHVSGSVERLSALGLISAIAVSADRRRQCWQLTFAGRALVLEVIGGVSVDALLTAPCENDAGRTAA